MGIKKAFAYILAGVFVLACFTAVSAWTPLAVKDDPLVRMPGTQPGAQQSLEDANRCFNCHSGYNPAVEPGSNWQGSMMAQSARDPLFWACLVVAAQDSIFATGRPNAVDICERCHFPKGWLENRSDPPNASAMTGSDYDGVQCDFCHAMVDPFYETTHAGTREGSDWVGYWDETNASATKSQPSANTTRTRDIAALSGTKLFNGNNFFSNNVPVSPNYTENSSGQYFVDFGGGKRASFADATGRHTQYYSRYHKSKYFCASCHDVSNPVLANLAHANTPPNNGTTVLPTEQAGASSYFHVERTFSEFMLSDYGLEGGAPGSGAFAPSVFSTSKPNNKIASCQNCHMRSLTGKGCDKNDAPMRPGSTEHPKSGVPAHDMTGGNFWISSILASTVTGSPNYNAVNANLLRQGANVLTLNLTAGMGIHAQNLLNGANRALQNLQNAATIERVFYNPASGSLTFRVKNHTGHKLISGFPEGRRMFVNIKAYLGQSLIYEVNPYDDNIGTLKGLPSEYSPSSPSLTASEAYLDELVYECHPISAITGEMEQTFHFALATGRGKDNRIPPRGFRINEAAARLSEPVWHGQSAPNYFTADEYAGGYDESNIMLPPGADRVEVRLYYQTTSREYIEFLRDEINGTGRLTLPTSAYIVQTDPFFAKLKAWGNTIWQLWVNNKNLAGSQPVQMAQATASLSLPVPQIKMKPNGSDVSIPGAIVTAAFDGYFYIQSDDRASGIRVQKSAHGVQVGNRVDVVGIVQTNSNKEKYIAATTVALAGSGSAVPMGMSGRTVGGASWMYDLATGSGQAGVTGGTGLSNTGLLISIWGTVTASGTDYFTVNDGSGIYDWLGNAGVRVFLQGLTAPSVGSKVKITGISSMLVSGGDTYRLLLPRQQTDILEF